MLSPGKSAKFQQFNSQIYTLVPDENYPIGEEYNFVCGGYVGKGKVIWTYRGADGEIKQAIHMEQVKAKGRLTS